ncbi:MAG TPA: nucleotidyltransferase family protein [Usitatibacter sp.]|nr:nucleotidyltransferase family protein [Usitatibacter sp.]
MASALILAAGRGERLRPLTDGMPKPLLKAGGRTLIEWQIDSLVRAGFSDLVINHAHLGSMIVDAIGDGKRYGAAVRYSPESPALETGGGIVQALPLLPREPFAVLSADIHTEYDYSLLHARIEHIRADPRRCAAHFVLVANPPYHPQGDMGLAGGLVTRAGPKLTYGNISVFDPAMFAGLARGTAFRLFPWAYKFVEEGRVSGELFSGHWDNVGTAEQLAALDRRLTK